MIGVRCLHKGRFAGGKVYHIPAAAFAILEIKTARTGSWIGLRRIGRIAGPHRSEHGLAAHGRRLTLRLTLLHRLRRTVVVAAAVDLARGQRALQRRLGIGRAAVTGRNRSRMIAIANKLAVRVGICPRARSTLA